MFAAYRYRTRLEKLIRQWTDYRGLVLTRLGTGDVQASEERTFLTLKGQIAEGLANLTGNLSQTVAQDANSHLRAMNSLLNRFPTLYADRALESKTREDFEREWHDHFLFFNKLKGMQAEPEPTESRTGMTLSGTGTKTIHTRTGGTQASTVLLRLIAVVAIVWLLATIIPWHRLGSGVPATDAAGAQGFLAQAWHAVKATFAGMDFSAVAAIFDPAVSRWGPEATLVLVSLLLIALGYWIFLRMK